MRESEPLMDSSTNKQTLTIPAVYRKPTGNVRWTFYKPSLPAALVHIHYSELKIIPEVTLTIEKKNNPNSIVT